MSIRQKQTKNQSVTPKMAINILTPNNENNLPEKLAFSQTLHKEYSVPGSTSNTKRSSKMENCGPESRMKLRDYLFLAKTSALKNADQKKKVLMTVCQMNSNANQQMQRRKMKSELRKDKYGIKNSEMFKILKQDMDKEIQESLEEICNIKNSLDKQLTPHIIPSNGQMVMMYNLRSLIKEKLRKSIDEMKELISIQGCSLHQERVQMEIDIDDEFKSDFKLAAIAYSKKILEITNKKS